MTEKLKTFCSLKDFIITGNEASDRISKLSIKNAKFNETEKLLIKPSCLTRDVSCTDCNKFQMLPYVRSNVSFFNVLIFKL